MPYLLYSDFNHGIFKLLPASFPLTYILRSKGEILYKAADTISLEAKHAKLASTSAS